MFALFLMSRAALAADCEVITDGSTYISRNEVKCYIVRDCVFEKIRPLQESSYVIQFLYSDSWEPATDVTITGVTLSQCTGDFGCFQAHVSGSLTISQNCVHSCSGSYMFHGLAMTNENTPITVNETSLVSCSDAEYPTLLSGFYLQGIGVNPITAKVGVANVNVTGCHLMTSQQNDAVIYTQEAMTSLRMLTLVGNSGANLISCCKSSKDNLVSEIEMTNAVANNMLKGALRSSVSKVDWSHGVFKENQFRALLTFYSNVQTTVTLSDSVFDKLPDNTDGVTTQNVQTQPNPTTHDIAALNTALCPGNFQDEEVPPVESPSEEGPGPDTATGEEDVDGTGDGSEPAIDQKPSTEDTGNQGGGDRLSGGEIAGIVVGVCAAIAIAAVVVVLLLVKRKKGERLQSFSDDV